MRVAIRSISKNLAKNVIYVILLSISFTAITLIVNTFIMGQSIVRGFDIYTSMFERLDDFIAHSGMLDIQKLMQSSLTSLMLAAILVSLLCILVLPFLQYLFSISRGYEIGVQHALGLGRGEAWARLQLENLTLTVIALIASLCLAPVLSEEVTLRLLAIDADVETLLTEGFNDKGIDFRGMLGFNWGAVATTACVAIAVMLISSTLVTSLLRKTTH